MIQKLHFVRSIRGLQNFLAIPYYEHPSGVHDIIIYKSHGYIVRKYIYVYISFFSVSYLFCMCSCISIGFVQLITEGILGRYSK